MDEVHGFRGRLADNRPYPQLPTAYALVRGLRRLSAPSKPHKRPEMRFITHEIRGYPWYRAAPRSWPAARPTGRSRPRPSSSPPPPRPGRPATISCQHGKRVSLSSIHTRSVQKWVTGLLGVGLSPSTVRAAHGLLSTSLNTAVSWSLIPSNPCEGVHLPKIMDVRHLSPKTGVKL